MLQAFPGLQVFDIVTQLFLIRERPYTLKEPLAKLLKIYLKNNGNIYFVVI